MKKITEILKNYFEFELCSTVYKLAIFLCLCDESRYAFDFLFGLYQFPNSTLLYFS